MVESCGGRLQRAAEECRVVWCGGCAERRVETPLLAFMAKQECLCSLTCLVWSDNKEHLQWLCWDKVGLMYYLALNT